MIKVEINEAEPTEASWTENLPALVVGGYGVVILATSKHSDGDVFRGVFIAGPCSYPVGSFDSVWLVSHFRPFNGSITLKNGEPATAKSNLDELTKAARLT